MDDVLGSAHCARSDMDRQTCTIRVSLPTKLSYMLLHLHTRHTRPTTLVILLTIVKEEGWDMHRRVSQATTRVSGARLKRGGPQWGRISKQLGWRGQGLASQFAPSPHLRGVSAAQRRGRLAHTCRTPLSQEEHLRASNARACRAPLAPPASCHLRPGHITDLSRLRHILRIFCASKEHFCNYILICNYAAFL